MRAGSYRVYAAEVADLDLHRHSGQGEVVEIKASTRAKASLG